MDQTIHIRRGTLADADLLIAGNIALAAETENKPLDPDVIGPGVRTALDDPTTAIYYVAHLNGTSVGQAMRTREWSDWRNGWLWWLQSVYVLPEYRRLGVFRALYDHIRAEAHAEGNVRGLRLYVADGNQAAIATYYAMGMLDAGYTLLEEEFPQAPKNTPA